MGWPAAKVSRAGAGGAEALAAMGYTHQAVSGQKGYHGVATVARVPIREVTRHDWQDNGEARHIGVEVLGKDLLIENVYVPAGGDVPDRAVNPKFGQKLDFLGRMTKWADRLERPTLIVGDFNRTGFDVMQRIHESFYHDNHNEGTISSTEIHQILKETFHSIQIVSTPLNTTYIASGKQ